MIEVNEETADIIEKSLLGRRISKEEAYDLLLSDSLFTLGSAADLQRQKKCGDAVTYIVNRNINFTNICQGSCKFCAYRVGKASKSGFLMSSEDVQKRVLDAAAAGATEVCIQGGLHPDLDLDYYTEILES
ncbi:MAG: radical SAM protein, partial [Candidatus Hydrothermarchaeales archaeon]